MTRRSTSDLVQPTPHVLRQYALIADGERGALVGPRGDMAFLCAPSWHDDAVFSSLLGGHGGYGVSPADDRFVWGGYYEPDSLIWRSRWVSTDAVTECREALAFPGEPDRVVLLRRIEATLDVAHVQVALDVRAEFGARAMTVARSQDGHWHGHSGDLTLPVDRGHPARAPRGRTPGPRPCRAGRRVARPGPGDLQDRPTPPAARPGPAVGPHRTGLARTACPT